MSNHLDNHLRMLLAFCQNNLSIVRYEGRLRELFGDATVNAAIMDRYIEATTDRDHRYFQVTPEGQAKLGELRASKGIFSSAVHISLAPEEIAKAKAEQASDITRVAAIIARINGEFDHPALLEYGPLGTDTMADVLAIARHEFRLALPALRVSELIDAIRARHSCVVVVMQPEDVLAIFGAADILDATEEETKARLEAAGKWLTEHADRIEESMVKAGFEAMAFQTPPAGIGADEEDGTSGQDRESYSDEQDRDSYTVEED